MPAANSVPRSQVTIQHDVGRGSDACDSRSPAMNLGTNSCGRGVWESEAQSVIGSGPVAFCRRCVGIACGIPNTDGRSPVRSEIGLQHEAAQGSAGRSRSRLWDPDHRAQGVARQKIAEVRRPTGTFGARAPCARCRGERDGANRDTRRAGPRVYAHPLVPLEPSRIVTTTTGRVQPTPNLPQCGGEALGDNHGLAAGTSSHDAKSSGQSLMGRPIAGGGVWPRLPG